MNTVFTKEELPTIARSVLLQCTPKVGATVVALSGELGAGKTAFSQAVAAELGVTETVVSPTFVIMKTYATTHAHFTKLVHIDAYRLQGGVELSKLGWSEILADSHTLVLIEWPEQVADVIPADALRVSLEHVSDSQRSISF